MIEERQMPVELTEGRYTIPDTLRMYIEPGARVLIVKKRKDRHIPPGDLRCQNCKHRIKGRMFPHKNYWFNKLDDICELRIKAIIGEHTYYYGAPYNRRPCDKFELKED